MPDFFFGAHEPLAHGGRRREKRGSNGGCIEPEHHLQHQRRTNAGVDGRMRAGEHQRETLIRNFRLLRRSLQTFRQDPQLLARHFVPAPPSDHIDHLSPRYGQQPRFRVRRAAVARPIRKSRGERLGERIFGGGHIPSACREKGDELAVAMARRRFRCLACLLIGLTSRFIIRNALEFACGGHLHRVLRTQEPVAPRQDQQPSCRWLIAGK